MRYVRTLHRYPHGMQDFLDIRFLGSVAVTLFVIMDPPAAVPAFLAQVDGKIIAEASHEPLGRRERRP